MKAYATEAVEFARRLGTSLDYSESSLERVDELLGVIAGEQPHTPSPGQDEDELWLLSKVFGAYVGEVVLTQIGGAWDQEDTDVGIRPFVFVSGLKAYPVTKVWKRLTESEFDGVSGYCRATRALLSGRDSL